MLTPNPEPRPGVPVPPDEWIRGLCEDYPYEGNKDTRIRTAAAWGADEQLRRCVEWLLSQGWSGSTAELVAAMRPEPKPPSLKQQALAALGPCPEPLVSRQPGSRETFNADLITRHGIVLRALEALPDED